MSSGAGRCGQVLPAAFAGAHEQQGRKRCVGGQQPVPVPRCTDLGRLRYLRTCRRSPLRPTRLAPALTTITHHCNAVPNSPLPQNCDPSPAPPPTTQLQPPIQIPTLYLKPQLFNPPPRPTPPPPFQPMWRGWHHRGDLRLHRHPGQVLCRVWHRGMQRVHDEVPQGQGLEVGGGGRMRWRGKGEKRGQEGAEGTKPGP